MKEASAAFIDILVIEAPAAAPWLADWLNRVTIPPQLVMIIHSDRLPGTRCRCCPWIKLDGGCGPPSTSHPLHNEPGHYRIKFSGRMRWNSSIGDNLNTNNREFYRFILWTGGLAGWRFNRTSNYWGLVGGAPVKSSFVNRGLYFYFFFTSFGVTLGATLIAGLGTGLLGGGLLPGLLTLKFSYFLTSARYFVLGSMILARTSGK